MIGTYARYLAGWAVVTALLLLALLRFVPGVAGDSGDTATILGVTICAMTDLVTFALVLKSLGADQRSFARLWGSSVFFKSFVLGASIALVSGRGWFPVDGFVRVLIVSFVVFAHHEVLWLVISQNKGRLKRAVQPVVQGKAVASGASPC